jgi:hypothetical protein
MRCASLPQEFRLSLSWGLATAVKAKGIFYIVAVRVTSHSRGRTQREGGIRARLWKAGKYYDVSPEGQQAHIAAYGRMPRLTERLHPGESVLSFQVFDLPRKTSGLGLVLDHGFTPGYFVIGESPVLNKPTMIQIN